LPLSTNESPKTKKALASTSGITLASVITSPKIKEMKHDELSLHMFPSNPGTTSMGALTQL
jgi:hypothetical protein